MKNADLISIIVPIYNSEKTLRKCLHSIINQTYKNIEIILINDGSKDSSKKICKEFEKKDERIVYMEQKNCGVSAARNTGLDAAKGNYISFVDSDDYIEKNYIEKMYISLRDNNADLCECNINYINKEYQILGKTKIKKSTIEDTYIIESDFLKYNNSYDYIANKMLKKSIIKKERFSNLIVSEDFEFFTRVYENVKCKVNIEDCLYNYFIYEKNNSADVKAKQSIEIVKAREIAFKRYKEQNKDSLAALTAVQLLSRIIIFYNDVDFKTKKILKSKYNNYFKYALQTKDTVIKRIYRIIKFTLFKIKI